jgi:fatty-acyl-CoA synthase
LQGWGLLLSNQIKRRHRAIPTPAQTGQPTLAPTPRTNVTLTQKLAEFDSLAAGLDYAAKGITGFNFYSARGQLVEAMSYRTLRERAVAMARRLAGVNLKRGDRVGLVAETGPEFMEAFFGCQYAGLVPCPMPYSMHIGGMDAYVERIAGMLRAAGARAAIAPTDLAAQVGDAGEKASVDVVLSYDE